MSIASGRSGSGWRASCWRSTSASTPTGAALRWSRCSGQSRAPLARAPVSDQRRWRCAWQDAASRSSSRLTVIESLAFFAGPGSSPEEGWRTDATADLRRDVVVRLERLRDAGLGYLSLDRPAATLSAGEAQRIRLATEIGSGLTGITYVLDEPTAGLHPRDTARLLGLLRSLRDTGNTVVVVEHDEDVIRAADHVIDLGPGAGDAGGHIVAAGPPTRSPPASRR